MRRWSESGAARDGDERLGEELRSRLRSIELKLDKLSGKMGVVFQSTAALVDDDDDDLPGESAVQEGHSLRAAGLACQLDAEQISHPGQVTVEDYEDGEDANFCGDVKMKARDRTATDTTVETMVSKRRTDYSRKNQETGASCLSEHPSGCGDRFGAMDAWSAGEYQRTSRAVRISGAIMEKTPVGRLVSEFLRLRYRAMEGEKPSTWGFAHNTTFELITSFIIIVNAFFIGYSGTAHLNTSVFGEPRIEWIDYVEVGFCIWFTLELLFRFIAERPVFFFLGEHWHWNILDIVIVSSSICDVLINGLDSGAGTTMTVGRLLRLSRFIRIFRLTRVLHQFTSLRVIMTAIVNSTGSLIWCFAVIVFVIYMFAVFLLFGLAEHARVASSDVDVQALQEMYSAGVYDVMVTLFMSICGGVDWNVFYAQWDEVDKIYGWIFLLYIFIMHFGVLNIVIATFVRETMDAVSRDSEKFIQLQVERMDDYAKKVLQFFKEADVDKTGTLSWDEFESHMRNSRVKAYFQALELDISQAHRLFELLDVDGDDAVSTDEFLTGCMRLRGGASSVDLNAILVHVEKLTQQMTSLRRRSHQQLGYLKEMSNHLSAGLAVSEEA